MKCTQSLKLKSFPRSNIMQRLLKAESVQPENKLIAESHSQNVTQRHFVLVKGPELSQKDKNIQTKVTSLFGKWNDEKVQIFVKHRYLKNLLKYRNKVFVFYYFPLLIK